MAGDKPEMDTLISSEDSNEYVNAISHFIGALLSLAGLIGLIAFSATKLHLFSFTVYGITLVLSFTASAILHFFLLLKKYRRILGIIDHNAIYLLIAGTYTPFCVVVLKGTFGWIVFGVVWGLALVNIVLKSLFFARMSKRLSMSGYLIMGWLAVFVIYHVYLNLGLFALILIAAGGLLYTVGSLIFFHEKPNPFPPHFGNHEIWHVSVFAANSIFFCVMLFFVAPCPI